MKLLLLFFDVFGKIRKREVHEAFEHADAIDEVKKAIAKSPHKSKGDVTVVALNYGPGLPGSTATLDEKESEDAKLAEKELIEDLKGGLI